MIWDVVDYVREEVSRQGHDVQSLDGIERVGWMLDAWSCALHLKALTLEDFVAMGKMVERRKNRNGMRKVNVRVGSRACPDWHDVPKLMEYVFARIDTLDPLDAYRAILEVHPFEDGNGRTSKVALNFKNGTLLSPIFPPADFWGRPIRNP